MGFCHYPFATATDSKPHCVPSRDDNQQSEFVSGFLCRSSPLHLRQHAIANVGSTFGKKSLNELSNSFFKAFNVFACLRKKTK